MTRNPKPHNDLTDARPSRFGLATNHGGLYDRNGPIPVPEAIEKDTDSAWALFEESVMLQDHPRDHQETKFDDTSLGSPDFEPTRHEEGYPETKAAPLKP